MRSTMQIYEQALLEHWRSRQRRFELSEIERRKTQRVNVVSPESKRLAASDRALPQTSFAANGLIDAPQVSTEP